MFLFCYELWITDLLNLADMKFDTDKQLNNHIVFVLYTFL